MGIPISARNAVIGIPIAETGIPVSVKLCYHSLMSSRLRFYVPEGWRGFVPRNRREYLYWYFAVMCGMSDLPSPAEIMSSGTMDEAMNDFFGDNPRLAAKSRSVDKRLAKPPESQFFDENCRVLRIDKARVKDYKRGGKCQRCDDYCAVLYGVGDDEVERICDDCLTKNGGGQDEDL